VYFYRIMSSSMEKGGEGAMESVDLTDRDGLLPVSYQYLTTGNSCLKERGKGETEMGSGFVPRLSSGGVPGRGKRSIRRALMAHQGRGGGGG